MLLPQGLELLGQVHGLFGNLMAPAAPQGWRIGLAIVGEHRPPCRWAEEVPVVAFQLDDLHGPSAGDVNTFAADQPLLEVSPANDQMGAQERWPARLRSQ